MLFKQKVLEQIKAGDVSLAFRKWVKPTVKSGSVINTSVGQLKILSVEKVSRKAVNTQAAQKAGFASLDELLKVLDARTKGELYKITLQYHAPDARVALREKDSFTDTEFDTIVKKLERLDKYSKQGSWTYRVLETIEKYPQRRAADLSDLLGREKDWLKTNIRKLKNLGLTISHEIGYSLSPRGKAFLKKQKK